MSITRCIRYSRWLGAAVLGGLIVSMVTPVWNIAGSYIAVSADPQPSDAIVVLAAGVTAEGTLSENSMRRAIAGLRLYKRGLAPKIVLSGPRNPEGFVE